MLPSLSPSDQSEESNSSPVKRPSTTLVTADKSKVSALDIDSKENSDNSKNAAPSSDQVADSSAASTTATPSEATAKPKMKKKVKKVPTGGLATGKIKKVKKAAAVAVTEKIGTAAVKKTVSPAGKKVSPAGKTVVKKKIVKKKAVPTIKADVTSRPSAKDRLGLSSAASKVSAHEAITESTASGRFRQI